MIRDDRKKRRSRDPFMPHEYRNTRKWHFPHTMQLQYMHSTFTFPLIPSRPSDRAIGLMQRNRSTFYARSSFSPRSRLKEILVLVKGALLESNSRVPRRPAGSSRTKNDRLLTGECCKGK